MAAAQLQKPENMQRPNASNGGGTRGFADLLPLVRSMEHERKLAASKLKAHILTFIPLIAIALAAPVFLLPRIHPFIVFSPLLILVVFAFFSIPKDIAKYKKRFKSELVRAIIKRFSGALEYHPESGATLNDFMNTMLFSLRPTIFKSEDLVTGQYNGVNLAFSEVRAKRVTTTGSGKNKRKKTEEVFSGVLFMAQFNKKFTSTTLVFPDVAEKLLGKMGQFFQDLNAKLMGGGGFSGAGMQLIRLDDPEFEKIFSVYGQDQVESRYILTPSFMQRLSVIGKRRDGRIAVSFRENRIAMAVTSKTDLFEAPLMSQITPEFVGGIIESIAGYLAIVDELKLNEHLWAKV